MNFPHFYLAKYKASTEHDLGDVCGDVRYNNNIMATAASLQLCTEKPYWYYTSLYKQHYSSWNEESPVFRFEILLTDILHQENVQLYTINNYTQPNFGMEWFHTGEYHTKRIR